MLGLLCSYLDDDFSGLVSARAGEHFVRRNRVGQRKNATHGNREFMSFVQLCKLRLDGLTHRAHREFPQTLAYSALLWLCLG
jgi:hypothetical protein